MEFEIRIMTILDVALYLITSLLMLFLAFRDTQLDRGGFASRHGVYIAFALFAGRAHFRFFGKSMVELGTVMSGMNRSSRVAWDAAWVSIFGVEYRDDRIDSRLDALAIDSVYYPLQSNHE